MDEHGSKQHVEYATQREFRNALARLPVESDVRSMSTPSNFAKLAAGTYGTRSHPELVTVQSHGGVWFSKEAFVDDVVAFCAGALRSNPTVSPELKQHLADFVNGMDARAVARHGYSNSEAERAFVWHAV